MPTPIRTQIWQAAKASLVGVTDAVAIHLYRSTRLQPSEWDQGAHLFVRLEQQRSERLGLNARPLLRSRARLVVEYAKALPGPAPGTSLDEADEAIAAVVDQAADDIRNAIFAGGVPDLEIETLDAASISADVQPDAESERTVAYARATFELAWIDEPADPAGLSAFEGVDSATGPGDDAGELIPPTIEVREDVPA